MNRILIDSSVHHVNIGIVENGELVEYIVKSLVENPDKVKVSTEEESEKVTILNIEVDSNDLGKVIGKGGKIANSIRTIVKSASAKSKKRFIVKINEVK